MDIGLNERVRNMAQAERALQNKIILALSKAGCLAWNNDTGKVQNARTGLWVSYGLCVGSSDIVGICPDGIALFVEVKTPTGRASKEQRDFITACRRNGARAGIARSVEDAILIMNGGILD